MNGWVSGGASCGQGQALGEGDPQALGAGPTASQSAGALLLLSGARHPTGHQAQRAPAARGARPALSALRPRCGRAHLAGPPPGLGSGPGCGVSASVQLWSGLPPRVSHRGDGLVQPTPPSRFLTPGRPGDFRHRAGRPRVCREGLRVPAFAAPSLSSADARRSPAFPGPRPHRQALRTSSPSRPLACLP